MGSEKAFSQKAAVLVVGVLIAAMLVLPRFMQGAVHEASGTITHIDHTERRMIVEVIDPANGNTQEFSGFVAADCEITVNGESSALTALRTDDAGHMRARIDRRAPDAGGKKRSVLVFDRIDVTRPEEETS